MERPISKALKLSNTVFQVNESIPLGKHTFEIEAWKRQLFLVGQVDLRASPIPYLHFEGEILDDSGEKYNHFLNKNHYSISEDGIERGTFLWVQHDVTGSRITGEIYGDVVFGDRSIVVDRVRFLIPNLPEFEGEQILFDDNGTIPGRIVFSDEKYEITIDKNTKYNSLMETWERSGGVVYNYSGELVQKTGNHQISYEDSKVVLSSLGTFLSFLRGRKTSPLIIQGMDPENETVLWTDCTKQPLDIVWNVHIESVIVADSTVDYSIMWREFRQLFKNEGDKRFLESAINWYLKANADPQNPEAPIIIAQTGMELIYNWLIVERHKIVLGPDAENISASNKLRLVNMLLKLNFDVENNGNLSGLKEFMANSLGKNNTPIPDVIEAIVQIRNGLVHSQMVKRTMIANTSIKTIKQAMHVFLLFMEVSLLYVLKHEGTFKNRLSNTDEDSSLPWIEK